MAAAEENAARVGIAILERAATRPTPRSPSPSPWPSRGPRPATSAAAVSGLARRRRQRAHARLPRDGARAPPAAISTRRRVPAARRPPRLEGPLASGVPGSVAGLALAHRRAGRLPWKAVVDPAVKLARDGFVITAAISESIADEAKRLAADPQTARIFLPGGAPPAPGVLFRQPDLARTLEAIRDRGEDGFYRGRVARGDRGRAEARRRPDHARRPRALRGEGPQARALPLSGPRGRDSAGPVLGTRPRRNGPHGGNRGSERSGRRARVGALARRDREARLPRPESLDRRPGVSRPSTPEALHRPGPAEGARRHDQPRPRHAHRRARPGLPRRSRRPRTSRSSTTTGHGRLGDDDAQRLVRQRARRAGPRLPLEQRDGRLRRRGRASPTCTAWSRASRTPSRPASGCSRRCARRSRSAGGEGRTGLGNARAARRSRRRISRSSSTWSCASEPSRRRSRRRASTSRTGPTRSRSSETGSTPPGSTRSARWATQSDEPPDAARPHRPGSRVAALPAGRSEAVADPAAPGAVRRRPAPRCGRRCSGRSIATAAISPSSTSGCLPGEDLALARDARPRSPSRSATWPCAARRRSASPRPTERPSPCGAAPPRRPRSASRRPARLLAATRPTAVNLFAALERMDRRLRERRRPSARGDRGGARRGGRRHRGRGHRGLPAHRALRRGAARRASAPS